MGAVEILRQARELISNENQWTQGASARNSRGLPVPARDPIAVCWCLAGAVEKSIQGGPFPYDVDSFLDVAAFELYGSTSFVEANDQNPDGHSGVLKVIDAALAMAEAANA